MKDELIICECGSAEHQMVMRYDDDKDLGRMVFVEIHLASLCFFNFAFEFQGTIMDRVYQYHFHSIPLISIFKRFIQNYNCILIILHYIAG